MKLRTLLDLARISNLPTVWSNVLAGAVLGTTAFHAPSVAAAGAAASLLYSGGMFLNDAFDAAIDASERPERPIPSNRIARTTVFALGFGMLALALGVLGVLVVFSDARLELVLTGLAIACGVLVYDRWHKGVAWSPVVMGSCRAGLYLLGALATVGRVSPEVLVPSASLLLYVVGLTHVARFENATAVGRVWPTLFVFAPTIVVVFRALFASGVLDVPLAAVLVVHVAWTLRAVVIALRGGRGAIPRAVVPLIAGISLVDALFVASRAARDYQALVVAFAAFGLTLLLQRWVRGT